jgi:ArsR family transcriptional regulator
MTDTAAPSPLPALKAVADTSRLRLLRLLDREELTVGELERCTGLPQSTVSRHTAVLRRAGLVAERSEGVRSHLRLAESDAAGVSGLLAAVMELVRTADLEHPEDLARLEDVRREREAGREELFDSLADDWDALRANLLGGRMSPPEIASLLVPGGLRIVDAGAGTGVLLPWLAELAGPDGEVVAVESAAKMARKAAARVKHLPNVEVRRGRIEDLPVDDRWADAVLLSLSLGHTPDAAEAVARCVQALRPGGRLVICDVEGHGDATLVRHLGAGFAGFEPDRLEEMLRAAGLDGVRRVRLPADADGNGNDTHPNGTRGTRTRAAKLPVLTPLLVVGTRPRRDRRTNR